MNSNNNRVIRQRWRGRHRRAASARATCHIHLALLGLSRAHDSATYARAHSVTRMGGANYQPEAFPVRLKSMFAHLNRYVLCLGFCLNLFSLKLNVYR